MSELLLATNNPGKLQELRQLFQDVPFRLVSPADIGLSLDVVENGRSYTANARLKAHAFWHASGLATVADDSGLEVAALGGAPGILSSRYAGPNANDTERVRFLSSQMNGLPPEQRTARFKCVMAIANKAGVMRFCSGSCRGLIAFQPSGSNGFGYDPVFYLPRYFLTMAELPADIKNTISHRARAARHARAILSDSGFMSAVK
jgi:XTP/dITP diphosphohydrolase